MFDCLADIYDLATSQNNWTRALDSLGNAVEAKGVMMFANNQADTPYAINTSNSLYKGTQDELVDYMEKFGAYEEEGIRHMLQATPLAPVKDTDIWPGLDQLRVRGDIAFGRARLGIFRRLIYNLSDNNGLLTGVIFQYPKELESIPQLNISNASLLVPHLAKAVQFNYFFHGLQQKFRAVLSVLDHVDVGICVLSQSGNVVVANTRAQEFLDEKDAIRLNPTGLLVPTETDQEEKLHGAIRKVSQTAIGKEETREVTLLLKRKSGKEPCLLEVSPLRDANQEMEQAFSGALAMIIDPEKPPNLQTRHLQALYDLTASEIEVADLLVMGKTVPEISEWRDVALDTVKNQCKSIYLKVGVNNRANFIRQLVSISPPIL